MAADIFDALARWLDQAGHGTYTPAGAVAGEWPICLESLPPTGGPAIGLFPYAGAAPDAGTPWDVPRVQVRVRGDRDSATSRSKALDIYNALHGLGSTVLPGGLWLQLATGVQSGPLPLGPDAEGLHEHACNFDIEWRNPTANRPEQ